MNCRFALMLLAPFFLMLESPEKPALTKSAPEPMGFISSESQDVLSPAGIFFVRDESIWQAAIDGSAQRVITKVGVDERYFWIPKTRKLIVAGLEEHSAARIKIVDMDSASIDTVHVKEVSGGNDEVGSIYYFTISVSQDGGTIAYGGDYTSGEKTVVYSTSTKSRRNFKCANALLSPDGETLAWGSDNNVYITSVNNGSEKQLTHFASANAVYKANPKNYYNLETVHDLIGWSRDGSRVLYYFGNYGQGAQNQLATSHIYGVDIRTQEVKQVSTSGRKEIDSFLDESSDGHFVYYTVWNVVDQVYSLRRVNVHSAEVSEVMFSGTDNSQTRFYPVASLSHSTDRIIYEWYEKDGSRRKPVVYVMDPNGAKSHKLIDRASHPKWIVRQ